MKTSMERVYPLAKDMQEQFEATPNREYVFFYDDGQVFRAFLADGVEVQEKYVKAYIGDNKTTLIVIPAESTWRLVHKSCLEFVNGATMEQLDLIGTKQKQDLREKMYKKLGWDMNEKGEVVKKKKKSGDEVDTSQIPLKTGQFL